MLHFIIKSSIPWQAAAQENYSPRCHYWELWCLSTKPEGKQCSSTKSLHATLRTFKMKRMKSSGADIGVSFATFSQINSGR